MIEVCASEQKEKNRKYENEMRLEFCSRSDNERFARTAVAAFVMQLDPTLEELADIKTAVSEAVTNSIIHAYNNEKGRIVIRAEIEDRIITVEIEDYGVGIADIPKAMEALYTSKPEMERSGMGFVFMEAFMDSVEVTSRLNEGTIVKMTKRINE